MRIVEDKALVVKTQHPAPILNNIRKSSVISHDEESGVYEVAVRWGLEEAQHLASLRMKDTPSPILRDYKWSGKFAPFAHQKETASFLTLNKKAFCFNEQGCVDSETEYLSPTGWVKLSEYAGGKVAQFHPETGMAEFVEPLEYVKLPCAEMVEFKSKYGIDQLLSPEHRVLHYRACRTDPETKMFWRVDSAQYLHDRLVDRDISDVMFKTTYTPHGGSGIPLTEAQLRLQIAVIADGHFGSNTNHCAVRVKKVSKVRRLRTLLAAAGVEYSETTPEYTGAEGFHIFKFAAPLRVKVFGPEFWEATQDQLRIVTEEVPYWDGSFRKAEGVAFFSIEKQSVDFVQHAFVSQGKVARVTHDGRGCWQVYVRNNTRLVSISNRHGKANTRMVPSTDGYKYCFMVPSTFLVFRRNGCVFVSGNTGKTASVIWAADYLMNIGQVNRVLVVCPLSIMKAAWQQDLFRFAMHRSCSVAYGDAKTRAKIINAGSEFVVINFDGLAVVKNEILNGGFDMIVVDEASSYQNAQTARWKIMREVANRANWLWMLTGTPAAQSPLGAYGLAKLVNPENTPKAFTYFRDQTMLKVSMYSWVPKREAKDIVHKLLQPAIRFEKAQCLDLPEVTSIDRDAPLTPQQSKYYRQLKKQMAMSAAGEEVTAVNAAAQITKLLQVSGGSVYTDTKEVLEFDVSNRINVVLEVIEEASNKVLVFVPFTHTIELLRNALEKKGITCGVINGAVSVNKRSELVQDFQDKKNPHVLIIQPQAASHGLTLTAADTIIWYAPVTSVETYLQANARINRPGQKNAMTIVHIKGSEVEDRLYKMLRGKIDNHQQLIDLYRQELAEDI